MKTDIVISDGIAVNEYNLSSGYQILFALCSDAKSGRKQITPFYTCRDYINDCIHSYYNDKEYLYNTRNKRELLDIKNLRLLVTCNFNNYTSEGIEIWRKNLYVGKHIINLYENLAGFSRKSVIAEVSHTNTRVVKRCWQLVGPKEWMRYSHLASMVTLILRCIVRNPTELKTPKSLSEAESLLSGLKKTCCYHADYSSYLPACLPMFRKLMTNLDKVIRLSSREVHQAPPQPEFDQSWHSRGGIFSLCCGRTGVKEIDEAIKVLMKS